MGAISTRTTRRSSPSHTKAAGSQKQLLNFRMIVSFNLPRLREELKARGLDSKGNKSVLINRLWEAVRPLLAIDEATLDSITRKHDPSTAYRYMADDHAIGRQELERGVKKQNLHNDSAETANELSNTDSLPQHSAAAASHSIYSDLSEQELVLELEEDDEESVDKAAEVEITVEPPRESTTVNDAIAEDTNKAPMDESPTTDTDDIILVLQESPTSSESILATEMSITSDINSSTLGFGAPNLYADQEQTSKPSEPADAEPPVEWMEVDNQRLIDGPSAIYGSHHGGVPTRPYFDRHPARSSPTPRAPWHRSSPSTCLPRLGGGKWNAQVPARPPSFLHDPGYYRRKHSWQSFAYEK